MKSAGVSPKGASASLSFVAKKERDGSISIDFVDSGSMSKPRPEELHRLEVSLGNRSKAKSDDRAVAVAENDGEDSPFQVVAKPASKKKGGKPPALPSKRKS